MNQLVSHDDSSKPTQTPLNLMKQWVPRPVANFSAIEGLPVPCSFAYGGPIINAFPASPVMAESGCANSRETLSSMKAV